IAHIGIVLVAQPAIGIEAAVAMRLAQQRHLLGARRRREGALPEIATHLPVAVVHGGQPHSGMLSCFFNGLASRLLRSMASARISRRRVLRGMMTSSREPRLAATNGLANFWR